MTSEENLFDNQIRSYLKKYKEFIKTYTKIKFKINKRLL